MTNYKTLDVWKVSMNLAKEVYQVISRLPENDVYGLSSQLRRAAVSVPANIAEGMGRQYKKDSIQFMYIARGSAYEVETLLEIARMTNLLEVKYQELVATSVNKTIQVLNGFIKYLKSANLK